MTSTSDGSLPEDQAKEFARQYAEDLQAEKMSKNNKLVNSRIQEAGDDALYGMRGMDLVSKVRAGEVNFI
mgnify:FL=1|tara:strand:- start:502 stop:711 length:210 start_codon:yes stop_codon:yes gene_type:complete